LIAGWQAEGRGKGAERSNNTTLWKKERGICPLGEKGSLSLVLEGRRGRRLQPIQGDELEKKENLKGGREIEHFLKRNQPSVREKKG